MNKALRAKLANSQIFLSIYASFFIFLVYTIMYAYRKPFSAGIYEGDTIWGVDAKILFILAQIFGYAISKFVGIRFLPTIDSTKRKYYIIGGLFVSWISLLGFAILPDKYKLISLFINGFPLGMIWGLVFSYLEGRRISEILNVGLSVCFIISSGIVKTFGVYIMELFTISEYWMPFVVGALCFPILLISVYFLDIIPKPSEKDILHRTKRVPMNKHEQFDFFKKFFFGLAMIILFYGSLTIFREMRDAFASNFWEEVGFFNTAIFTQTEIPIAIILTILMGTIVFIKNNHIALNILYLIAALGGIIMISSTIIYMTGAISPILWMIIVGTGLFMGYIPFSFIIERLISSLRISSTAIFILYMGDSVGYFGSAGVFLYKNFSKHEFSWNQMLTYTSLITGVFSLITIVATYLYFRKYFKSKQFLDTFGDGLNIENINKQKI